MGGILGSTEAPALSLIAVDVCVRRTRYVSNTNTIIGIKEFIFQIDRIARNTAELSDITFKVAKERIYQRLSFVLQKWNAHSIAMKLDAVI
jgi:hypothetical protein